MAKTPTPKLNGYELSRDWFDYCYLNPEKIKPIHTAIYFMAIEHCNRLGWKYKFGFPTTMVMEAIGVKSYNTYIKALNDIVGWGFIEMIERSKNQYSANIVALSKYEKALYKALDKAFIKHDTKQDESIDSIDKQDNKEQETIKQEFEQFWSDYDKKIDRSKTFKKWLKLTVTEKAKIFQTIHAYVKLNPEQKFRKNPLSYLNGECWNDEIKENNINGKATPPIF